MGNVFVYLVVPLRSSISNPVGDGEVFLHHVDKCGVVLLVDPWVPNYADPIFMQGLSRSLTFSDIKLLGIGVLITIQEKTEINLG